MGTLEGCEPGKAFPENTTAKWIGLTLGPSDPIALRTVIHIEPIGFAAGVRNALHAPYAEGSEARLHRFNNVFTNTPDWTVGASCMTQVRLEGCIFENGEVVSRLSVRSGSAERGLMNAVVGTNVYLDCVVSHFGGDGEEPRR